MFKARQTFWKAFMLGQLLEPMGKLRPRERAQFAHSALLLPRWGGAAGRVALAQPSRLVKLVNSASILLIFHSATARGIPTVKSMAFAAPLPRVWDLGPSTSKSSSCYLFNWPALGAENDVVYCKGSRFHVLPMWA